MKKLDKKVALITGGGRGIGEAISYAFAEEGADIGIIYVNNKSRAEQVCNAATKKYGVKAISIKADIAIQEDVQNMVDIMLKEFGRIDILVNNAGTAVPRSLEETSLELWNHTIGVDLTGTFLCTKAVAPHMIARKQGKIINVSAAAALYGKEGLSAYAAAKGGVNSFTKAVARELVQHGILVNTLSPGPTETELFHTMPAEMRKKIDESLPLGRVSSAEDIAKSAVFLASSDSDCYVGQNLSPNCGDFML